MFLGYDAFGYDDGGGVFQTMNSVHNINKMQIMNAVFDEISVQEGVIDKIYSTNKEIWQSDQILLAKFKENLEAGNVENDGTPIEDLKFKKRKTEDFEWINVTIVPYDNTKRFYQYIDKYACAGDEYEYAVCPSSANVDGKNTVAKIITEFDGLWLIDKDMDLSLKYNLNVGDYENIMQSATFETIDSQYPIINYNSVLDYRKGNIKALLISDNVADNFGKIDVRKEKVYRDSIMKFLKNKKTKLLKDGSGQFIALTVTGSPRLIPDNNLGQMIYDVNFEWIEIKDAYEYANEMFKQSMEGSNSSSL